MSRPELADTTLKQRLRLLIVPFTKLEPPTLRIVDMLLDLVDSRIEARAPWGKAPACNGFAPTPLWGWAAAQAATAPLASHKAAGWSPPSPSASAGQVVGVVVTLIPETCNAKSHDQCPRVLGELPNLGMARGSLGGSGSWV